MAKLQVTLDYVGVLGTYYNENFERVEDTSGKAYIQRTAEVYVDLYTRGVYNFDGVFLGTTHLWLPANPNNGQEITLWNENFETITTSVTVSENGKQYTFQTGSQVIIKNQTHRLGLLYDLDTGLGVSRVGGQAFRWDPLFATVGIVQCNFMFFETNIDLRTEHSEINWKQILYYSIIPVAIILLIITLVIKHKKKSN
jgi:hypothetical protein